MRACHFRVAVGVVVADSTSRKQLPSLEVEARLESRFLTTRWKIATRQVADWAAEKKRQNILIGSAVQAVFFKSWTHIFKDDTIFTGDFWTRRDWNHRRQLFIFFSCNFGRRKIFERKWSKWPTTITWNKKKNGRERDYSTRRGKNSRERLAFFDIFLIKILFQYGGFICRRRYPPFHPPIPSWWAFAKKLFLPPNSDDSFYCRKQWPLNLVVVQPTRWIVNCVSSSRRVSQTTKLLEIQATRSCNVLIAVSCDISIFSRWGTKWWTWGDALGRC